MCVIRKASLCDADDIFKIESRCFPKDEAASFESIRARIAVFQNSFFVLENGNKICGLINGCTTNISDLKDEMYSDVSFHNPDGKWQMVFSLAVEPNFQHKGYATKLMDHLIKVSENSGKSGIVLTCKEKLIPFYRKFGFLDEGISESTHGNVEWHQMKLSFKK